MWNKAALEITIIILAIVISLAIVAIAERRK